MIKKRQMQCVLECELSCLRHHTITLNVRKTQYIFAMHSLHCKYFSSENPTSFSFDIEAQILFIVKSLIIRKSSF